jgi:arylsulfatase A-like enzyme
MTEMVDLLPTVFELCKVPETFPHNGKSLMPLIRKDEGYQHKQYAFSEGGFLVEEERLLERGAYPYDIKGKLQHEQTKIVGKATCCRDKEWTYIHRLYEPGELYHRAVDPGERHNLIGLPQYAHIQAKYHEIVFQWIIENADLMSWKQDFFHGPQAKIRFPTPREQLLERMSDMDRGKDEPKDHWARQ